MEPDELTIEAEIEQLADRLDSAQKAIGRGESIDLTGLDKQTNSLCQRIGATDPVPRHFLPSLEALFDKLNYLENDLKRQKTI
jgi:hypothetical protein